MEWWGDSNHLEYVDERDALVIRATSLRRLGDLLLPSGLALAFAVAFWFGGAISILLALGGLSAILFFNWFEISTIELRVTERDIRVRSSGGSLSAKWEDIKGLEYRAGGEDEPGGLYGRQGRWTGICLSNQLNRKECGHVINMIFSRFPYVQMAEDNDGGFLGLGKNDEIISLGLSRNDPASSSKTASS